MKKKQTGKVVRDAAFYRLPAGKRLQARIEMVVALAKLNGTIRSPMDVLHERGGLFKAGRLKCRKL